MKKSDSYLGNENLPKAGTIKTFDRHQLLEYKKCKVDPAYFAEKYFMIVHADHGLIPLELYEFQKKAIKAYQLHRKIALNTSRQVGKTTVATAIILHFALFNKNKRIALLANKADTSREILSRIQLAYEYLPNWLKGGVREWNKGSVEFENGSTIIAAASSSSAIRGKTCSLVYIDECAFVENWEEFSASVLPTLSSGKTTKTIFTSTPNGLNHFWSYCEGAKKGSNGFFYIEVPWYDVPGRDEEWKKEVLGTINNDMERFFAEYECQFQGSSGTLISGATLKLLSPENPIFSRDGLRQYKAPIKEHQYVLVADVSRGKGLDYSAFQVIDVTTQPFEQVCVYRNNLVTPNDYASVINGVGVMYNKALVMVEINDIGGQVSDTLNNDFEYENLVYTANNGRNGKRISGGSGDMGIRTTTTVKSIGCSVLKLLVENMQLRIVDEMTIFELSRFSKKGKSYEAEPGCHDDTVMCLVLFAWLSNDKFFKELCDRDVMALVRERTDEEIMSELSPFGLIYDGTDDDQVANLHEDFGDNSIWTRADSVSIW